VELCETGSLEDFLKSNRPNFVNWVKYGKLEKPKNSSIEISEQKTLITTLDLLKWTKDIANGLEYVHSKQVIHGDLAVRNILLSSDLSAKISDFGLSRQILNCSNYVKKTKVRL